MEIDLDHLRSWIGREDRAEEQLTSALVQRFNATLDRTSALETGAEAPAPTFNGRPIHYDTPYTGGGTLSTPIVHGLLQAALLCQFAAVLPMAIRPACHPCSSHGPFRRIVRIRYPSPATCPPA